jgi:hypothetical protein
LSSKPFDRTEWFETVRGRLVTKPDAYLGPEADDLQDLARTAIEDQDNEIAQRSGQRRAKIKSIARA